jgi:DUF1365 family protein
VTAIYECAVEHARHAPVRNRFRYGTYLWLVDVDDLPHLPWPLRPFARFCTEDHLGAGSPGSLRSHLDAYLATEGVDLRGGRVQLLTAARVLGHVFNPMSVYWCHDPAGGLVCAVVEVHNTYGDRHCYLVRLDEHGRAAADKAMYVSPFEPVEGHYEMQLAEPGEHLDVAIVRHRAGTPPFVARLRGTRLPATPRSFVRLLLRHPLAPWVVTLRIRRQGIALWFRGLRISPRPTHHRQEAVQ